MIAKSLEQTETQNLNTHQQQQQRHNIIGLRLKCFQNAIQSEDQEINLREIHMVQDNFQQNNQKALNNQIFQDKSLQTKFLELKQSLKCKLDNLYNAIVSSVPLLSLLNQGQVDQSLEIDLVEEYIATKYSYMEETEISKLLIIIELQPRLKEFLQWIYDAAPMLFYEQLIFVTCKLILAYLSHKNTNYEQNVILMSHNTIFLNQVFNDPALRFLKISCQGVGVSQIVLYAPIFVLTFINYFTQKFLEMIDISINKSFQKRSQSEDISLNRSQKSLDKRKKSKKIKKSKKSYQTKEEV